MKPGAVSSQASLKIGLIGYGKMGKMVEKEAKLRGHVIAALVDHHTVPSLSLKEAIDKSDILIDFSSAESVPETIHACAKAKKNLVIGTTGWGSQDQAMKIAKDSGIGVLFSPNFSIGMLLFIRLVSDAARLYSKVDGYDIGGFETHHSKKADSPSGTAKAIAAEIIRSWPQKTEILYDVPEGIVPPQALHFGSLRMGFCPGMHQVTIDSPQDTITLTHSAKGREGFALGAVLAAEWLYGKTGYFTMEDLLEC